MWQWMKQWSSRLILRIFFTLDCNKTVTWIHLTTYEIKEKTVVFIEMLVRKSSLVKISHSSMLLHVWSYICNVQPCLSLWRSFTWCCLFSNPFHFSVREKKMFHFLVSFSCFRFDAFNMSNELKYKIDKAVFELIIVVIYIYAYHDNNFLFCRACTLLHIIDLLHLVLDVGLLSLCLSVLNTIHRMILIR